MDEDYFLLDLSSDASSTRAAILLHTMQRGIKRALFAPQHLIGNSPDVESYAPSVHGTAFEASQHKQREGPLKGILLRFSHCETLP